MTVVKTPVEGYNGKVAGVSFVDGVGETDDANALAYFTRHGYDVDAVEAAYPDGAPSDEWKLPELLAWAADHNVDLGGAKKKADILAVVAGIEAWLEAEKLHEGAVGGLNE